jgi:hypothetical protein
VEGVGGEVKGGADICGGGAVDAGYVDAFLLLPSRVSRVLLCPSLVLLLLLCCILLLLADLSLVLWGPFRHLWSLKAAKWVSFDFIVAYSSC